MQKNMQKKRGQAALEFLTTYGWAFLVILVMIGALSYFGVLDPSKFLPNRCQFETGLDCGRYTLDSNGAGDDFALFELVNNRGTTLFVTAIDWSNDGSIPSNACTVEDGGVAVALPAQYRSGATWDVTCDLAGDILGVGTKEKINVRMTYNEGATAAPAYETSADGEIYAKVTES